MEHPPEALTCVAVELRLLAAGLLGARDNHHGARAPHGRGSTAFLARLQGCRSSGKGGPFEERLYQLGYIQSPSAITKNALCVCRGRFEIERMRIRGNKDRIMPAGVEAPIKNKPYLTGGNFFGAQESEAGAIRAWLQCAGLSIWLLILKKVRAPVRMEAGWRREPGQPGMKTPCEDRSAQQKHKGGKYRRALPFCQHGWHLEAPSARNARTGSKK